MSNRLQLCLCAAAAMAALSFPAAGQSSLPPQSRVTITHVKPEMLTEWVDLQKNEVVPALKKAGETTRTVYSTGLFGNGFEYVVVAPFKSYAQFDSPSPIVKALGQPGAARLNEKLRKCVLSSMSFSSTARPELSNVLDAPPPEVVIMARYRITTGKMKDFEDLVKSEILPVYKKAKINFVVNRRGVGANPNDVVMATGYQKWAEMDGGTVLTKQLGPEGAAKVNAKFVGMRNLIEVVVRHRVDDLSF